MRERRPKQLFPTNGKWLYEQLRSDYEPVMVEVYREGECNRHTEGEPFLLYSKSFDPMLYFWPVAGQHVVVRFNERPLDADRLVKALKRDGAMWITVISKSHLTQARGLKQRDSSNERYSYEHWGDAEGFMRQRYGPEVLESLAVSGRRGRACH